jgi:hypothetical protein
MRPLERFSKRIIQFFFFPSPQKSRFFEEKGPKFDNPHLHVDYAVFRALSDSGDQTRKFDLDRPKKPKTPEISPENRPKIEK